MNAYKKEVLERIEKLEESSGIWKILYTVLVYRMK